MYTGSIRRGCDAGRYTGNLSDDRRVCRRNGIMNMAEEDRAETAVNHRQQYGA